MAAIGIASSLLILLVAAAFTTQLHASGIAQTDAFLTETDSVAGQDVLARHFDAGAGSPAVIIGAADTVDQLVAVAQGVDGVATVAPLSMVRPVAARPGADPGDRSVGLVAERAGPTRGRGDLRSALGDLTGAGVRADAIAGLGRRPYPGGATVGRGRYPGASAGGVVVRAVQSPGGLADRTVCAVT